MAQKFFLIFNGRFPSEKAAGLFAAKSGEAFAEEGLEVSLLVPRRFRRSSSDAFEYYRLRKNFTVRYLPTIDLFPIPFLTSLAFYLSYAAFSFSSFLCLLAKSKRDDIIYSNEILPLCLISFFRENIYYELHDMPRSKIFFYKVFFKKMKGMIVTNTWKMERLKQDFGIESGRMLVEMNAVDVEEFDISDTREGAREKLGVLIEGPMALYTGHLYRWKGVDTLGLAAKLLPGDVNVYFVGGTMKDIGDFKERFGNVPNIVIVGHRPHTEMPLWQKAADVVVAPNTAKEAISKYDTSPMKIFEYMASQKPIVATDIPSIREILNETNAVLVPADDPKKMAAAIAGILQDTDHARKIATQTYADVQTHAWRERAKRVLVFIKHVDQ